MGLMRDNNFDVGTAFESLAKPDSISRDCLFQALPTLDQPHIDILFTKLLQGCAGKTITYAEFIEIITPRLF